MNTLDYLISRANQLGIKVDYPGEATKEIKAVTCDALSVRAGPSAKADIVDYLLHGDQVTVLNISGGWTMIGYERWVNSQYLKDA
jgi:hypothetical protein